MTYTLDELRTDEAKLRQAVGEVLKPGPWKHEIGVMDIAALERNEWLCIKCLQPKPTWSKDCPIPDPDDRPWPVIEYELIKKLYSMPCSPFKVFERAVKIIAREVVNPRGHDWLFWYVFETDADEQVLACLLALGKVQLPDPKRGWQDCHVEHHDGPGDNNYVYG